jgi:hypothetical protein
MDEWTNRTFRPWVEGIGCVLFLNVIGFPFALLSGWLVPKPGWVVESVRQYTYGRSEWGHAWVW